MKKIRVLVKEGLVIGNLTLSYEHPTEVWNEEILNSEEAVNLIKEGKIEIIEGENGDAE